MGVVPHWDINTAGYPLYYTRNGRVLTWDPGAPGGPGGPCGPGGPVGRAIGEHLRTEKLTASSPDLNRGGMHSDLALGLPPAH